MKIEEFNERLKSTVLVADGAMGSMLYEYAGAQRCLEELNVTQPEAVFRIHQSYLEAGAQIHRDEHVRRESPQARRRRTGRSRRRK